MSLGIVVIGKDVNTLNTLLYKIDAHFWVSYHILIISNIPSMVKLCRHYKDLTTIESKRSAEHNKKIAIYALMLLDMTDILIVERPLDVKLRPIDAKDEHYLRFYKTPWTTYPESLAVLSDIQRAFDLNPPLLTSRSTYK